MYLKKLKLTNYRKFSEDNNVIEFIRSDLQKKQKTNYKNTVTDVADAADRLLSAEKDTDASKTGGDKCDVGSDTTLIIGKNNAGKTTVITALDNLINHEQEFGINDFNLRYLQKYLSDFNISNPPKEAPSIVFQITIGLEEDSDDLMTGLVDFMQVGDVDDNDLDIIVRYQINNQEIFLERMKKYVEECDKNPDKQPRSLHFFMSLLEEIGYQLHYYDKNNNEVHYNVHLSKLIDIKCIKANHITSDNCLSKAFNKIVRYRYTTDFQSQKKDIDEKLAEINSNLSNTIKQSHTEVLAEVMKKLVSTKHMEVDLSADITFEKLMTDLVRYDYKEADIHVPETQFGLGYTNLVMIIADIMDYMEHYPTSSFNSKVNIIAIEEPEAYMHPQMQELFIENINTAIETLLKGKGKDINSQIIITTHSPHILNSKIQSGNTFDNICYLHEKDHGVVATNLSNQSVIPDLNAYQFTADDDEKAKKEKIAEQKKLITFLKKHIKFKVSDLFFADAAIFVEGFAEDIIIPFYLEKENRLNQHYITVFNIGGAHGFLYSGLIDKLGIPVAIITDLDIKRKKGDLSQIIDLQGHTTTNKTIINLWGSNNAKNHKGIEKNDISSIPANVNPEGINNLYLAYQGKINGYYATSFEEALILTNYDHPVINDILKDVRPGKYKEIIGKDTTQIDYSQNMKKSYQWQEALSNSKGDFASSLFYELCSADENTSIPVLPDYIQHTFDWIADQLEEE